jgi:hypothetical protein
MQRRVIVIPRPSWRIRIAYIVLLGFINLGFSYALITILDPHLLPAAIHGRNSYILGLQVLMCFFFGEVASLDHHAPDPLWLRLLNLIMLSCGVGFLTSLCAPLLISGASNEVFARYLLLAGAFSSAALSLVLCTTVSRELWYSSMTVPSAPFDAGLTPQLSAEIDVMTVQSQKQFVWPYLRLLLAASLASLGISISSLALILSHWLNPFGTWTWCAAGCTIIGFLVPVSILAISGRKRSTPS